MSDDDEFLAIVGTNVSPHTWFCKTVIFDGGDHCAAILTTRTNLHTKEACRGCQHHFTKCVCCSPLTEGGVDVVCYGDGDGCPYSEFVDPDLQHTSFENMMRMLNEKQKK